MKQPVQSVRAAEELALRVTRLIVVAKTLF